MHWIAWAFLVDPGLAHVIFIWMPLIALPEHPHLRCCSAGVLIIGFRFWVSGALRA
jgi:hypothetical protein